VRTDFEAMEHAARLRRALSVGRIMKAVDARERMRQVGMRLAASDSVLALQAAVLAQSATDEAARMFRAGVLAGLSMSATGRMKRK
jgi:hypothetical protein